ncbi:MAG: glycosyltransferase family 4 protein [Candidatus Aenigmatarchaeota archaeon]
MKILFVTPFYLFPPYWGGGTRTYNLVKHLAKNHEVFLISPFYRQFEEKRINTHRFELERLGVKVFTPNPLVRIEHPFTKHINPEVILKGLEIILKEKIDVMICDYPWAGINVLVLHFLTRIPFILHEHNIEFIIKDEIRAKYGRLMKLLELLLCKASKKVVVVSQNDKELMIKTLKVNKKKISVVENGFDKNLFYPKRNSMEKIRKKYNLGNNPIVLFFGKLDYPPNKEAVFNIRWKIMPKVLEKIPNAKFLIVGKKYEFGIEHEAMVFTGLVDDIENYINVADVVIVPILAGSGTRIKILEAIACGKVVVSTSKGAEGLINELTKPFLKISDDWETFSNLIVESIQNPEKKEVPKEFEEKYAWQNIYKKFNKILESV